MPEHIGSCGRLTAQTYGGATLNSFGNVDWLKRAYLAYQLLIAAIKFTFNHDKFAFYLTDISPDNIAVDDDFTLTFIDLENVILKLKNEGKSKSTYPLQIFSLFFNIQGDNYHHSVNYEEGGALFTYSEDEICNSAVSDHNIYAVCKVSVSQKIKSFAMIFVYCSYCCGQMHHGR